MSALIHLLDAPEDFQARLREVRRNPDENSVHELRALAQYRLGYLETIQLDRALVELPPALLGDAEGLPRLKLAVLADVTSEHLLPGIRTAGLRHGLLLEVHATGYGQYRQALLDESSELTEFAPDLVLLAVSQQRMFQTIAVSSSFEAGEQVLDDAVAELVSLWVRVRERFAAGTLQQTCLDVSPNLFGSHELLVPGAASSLTARFNDKIRGAAVEHGVTILDIAQASARDGLDHWFDAARWFQAKTEIAPTAVPDYGELVGRVVGALRGQSKKCLVLDLDNTLWGGVIGDDGLEGIVLGEGSAAGEAHLAVQRYAKQLRDRGVLLAVCSKNEPEIAQAAFESHPEMLLELGDIAAFVANWTDKATNIRSIAEQLNIGIDSLVFVDDNPAERERVRGSLPEVAVPELPPDPAGYVPCIAAAGYFESVGFTQADMDRADQYQANAERTKAAAAADSMDDYLCSLEMTALGSAFTEVDMPRIVQLFNKTNQFNTTTQRFSGAEIERYAADPAAITLQFRLVDRFGDNGIVSLAILEPRSEDRFELVNWVMSCRVFGRQLEDLILNTMAEEVLQRGGNHIDANLVPTPKNGVIKDLFSDLGFKPMDAESLSGTTRWTATLDGYAPRDTHISREMR